MAVHLLLVVLNCLVPRGVSEGRATKSNKWVGWLCDELCDLVWIFESFVLDCTFVVQGVVWFGCWWMFYLDLETVGCWDFVLECICYLWLWCLWTWFGLVSYFDGKSDIVGS